MADLSKNHEKWIKGFTPNQFDILVKSVINAYWKIDTIVFTDGAGDGGVDIKIFSDKNQIKIPIQVTTNAQLLPKLKTDLVKIQEKISKYGYSNNFYFFTNQSPQDDTKDPICEIARTEYGINLSIFDAKFIGSLAENKNYSGIRSTIRELLGDFLDSPKLSYSQYDRMKFDLLTHGGDVTEIKSNIIRGFILNKLFIENETSKTVLRESVENEFGEIDHDLFERQINWLRTNKKINQNENNISLSEKEFSRISDINESLDFQEKYFISEIKLLLKDFGIENNYSIIINEIVGIYKAAYKRDLEEIKENPEQNGYEINAVKQLGNYLTSILNEERVSDQLLQNLIEICELNDYLQRISAGEVFSNITNLPQIENYIRRQPKPVYIDTPLLLYMMCIYIQKSNSFDNVYYNAVTDLIQYCKNGEIKLVIRTTEQYVRETAFQLLNAFRLVPFTKLDIFENLGKSSNLFYTYYLHLHRNYELEYDIETFEDFMEQFDIEFDVNEDSFLNYISEYVAEVFKDNNIEVTDVSKYEYDHSSKKRFEEIKELFERHHLLREDNRAEKTIKNDALMLCHLFNDTIHEIEPTVLTWDSSFNDVRKNYHKKHKNIPFWHLFRPAKFVDHLSLIKFRIDSKVLSRDILSIIEDDFNIQEKVRCLNDTLLRIINLENASGLKLTKEISDIRKNYIFNLNQEDKVLSEKEVTTPIDEVVINLSSYYHSNKGKYNIREFKNILLSDIYIDDIITMWKNEAELYKLNRKISVDFFASMDNIIDKSKLNNMD